MSYSVLCVGADCVRSPKVIPIQSLNGVSVYVVTSKQKILNGHLCTPAIFN